MKLFILVISFVAGVFLATQSSVSSQIGGYLKNSVAAAFAAFSISSSLCLIYFIFNSNAIPTLNDIKSVPIYLWLMSGTLSFIALNIYFYAIPKAGIAAVITCGLCGQLVFSVIASHFGWFDAPQSSMFSLTKVIGVIAMIAGIVLVNIDFEKI